ncbi:uncharacterized protein LOC107267561 isoform X2 [Cephus cinctus]|uniref:Uncharacterized protein LOC107267561 isoform X2 n=1 Tax=Cephus cinctus TaxID=211228 RepID=A0AAJ7BUV7_CEPCN|nr:uncharacterized protein LOC107267561 isoform X2 [Cephus cinctus]
MRIPQAHYLKSDDPSVCLAPQHQAGYKKQSDAAKQDKHGSTITSRQTSAGCYWSDYAVKEAQHTARGCRGAM